MRGGSKGYHYRQWNYWRLEARVVVVVAAVVVVVALLLPMRVVMIMVVVVAMHSLGW